MQEYNSWKESQYGYLAIEILLLNLVDRDNFRIL